MASALTHNKNKRSWGSLGSDDLEFELFCFLYENNQGPLSDDNRKSGVNMAQICRELNGVAEKDKAVCFKRCPYYANPRKRGKTYVLGECNCIYKYNQVRAWLNDLANRTEFFKITKEKRPDPWQRRGWDLMKIVRMTEKGKVYFDAITGGPLPFPDDTDAFDGWTPDEDIENDPRYGDLGAW